ncbi:MAG: TRAP transporter large permease subunit [Alphaproteobacteria bacterium]
MCRPAGLRVAAGRGSTGRRAWGQAVAALLIRSFGENLLAVLILSAIRCHARHGRSASASYITAVSVAGPLLIRLGLDPLVAHLFIFYFAILSAITPPVCASVYAAATIAGENFWKVAGQALRIAGAVYFVPFMFVWRPGLLLMAPTPDIIYDSIVTFVAIVAFGAASIGYWYGNLKWPMRIVFYALGFLLFYPAWWTDIVGLVGVVGLGVWRWYTRVPDPQIAKA